MSSPQLYVRPVMSVALIGLSVLGLLNVYSDNAEVEEMAREVACDGCEPTLRQVQRTPLSQSFHLMTDSEMVVVSCSKSGIFVGEYSCEKER